MPVAQSPPPEAAPGAGAATRVLYVVYANPAAYPPLEHSARLLSERGAGVRFLGTVAADDVRRFDAAVDAAVEVDLVPFEPGGWRQKAHYAAFALRARHLARTWRPTWVYASDALSATPALMAARASGASLVYHEHDAPVVASGASMFTRGVLRARRAAARRASVCVVPSPDRVASFQADTGAGKVTVVLNTPLRREAAPQHRSRPATGLRLVYHGSIVPARLPETVLDALARLPPDVTLQVAGYETAGHRGYVDRLRIRANDLGLAGRVGFAGTAPTRADLLARCAGGDVGLALMPLDTTDFNECTMAGASNKPFDYLACNLALLVADRPEWRSLFVGAEVAQVCDPGSPESIASALYWFRVHPDERQRMSSRGRQLIDARWNYDTQFAAVADRILDGGA